MNAVISCFTVYNENARTYARVMFFMLIPTTINRNCLTNVCFIIILRLGNDIQRVIFNAGRQHSLAVLGSYSCIDAVNRNVLDNRDSSHKLRHFVRRRRPAFARVNTLLRWLTLPHRRVSCILYTLRVITLPIFITIFNNMHINHYLFG